MNTDNILPVRREHLLLMQVLCWLAPGIVIMRKGILSLTAVATANPQRLWWLIAIAVVVAVLFSLMFNSFYIAIYQ